MDEHLNRILSSSCTCQSCTMLKESVSKLQSGYSNYSIGSTFVGDRIKELLKQTGFEPQITKSPTRVLHELRLNRLLQVDADINLIPEMEK